MRDSWTMRADDSAPMTLHLDSDFEDYDTIQAVFDLTTGRQRLGRDYTSMTTVKCRKIFSLCATVGLSAA